MCCAVVSSRALEVFAGARSLSNGDGLVFPSPATGRALTNEAFPKLLRELDINGTVHGMRTASRSWAAEQGVNHETAEGCLAHIVKGVKGAYQRSDLLTARVEVMQRWARCVSEKGAWHREHQRALALCPGGLRPHQSGDNAYAAEHNEASSGHRCSDGRRTHEKQTDRAIEPGARKSGRRRANWR